MRRFWLIVVSVSVLLLTGTEVRAQTISISTGTAKNGTPGLNYFIQGGNSYFLGFTNNSKLYDGMTVSGPRGTVGVTAGKTTYPGTTIPLLYGYSRNPIGVNYVLPVNNFLTTFGYGNLSPGGLKKKP